MSILIKGMEMPPNCCQCPVNMEVCERGYEYLLEHPELYDKRADDCPLVPVPPHGRCIDANEFLKRAIGTKCFRGDYALMLEELVGESTTIIPAEEGE